MLWWLLSSMATESYLKLIKTGWTATCFDSILIIATAQVRHSMDGLFWTHARTHAHTQHTRASSVVEVVAWLCASISHACALQPATQVLSFATSYALDLLYLVPVLIVWQAVKVCLTAKNLISNVMGCVPRSISLRMPFASTCLSICRRAALSDCIVEICNCAQGLGWGCWTRRRGFRRR